MYYNNNTNNIHDVCEIMRQDTLLSNCLKYNEFTGKTEISGEVPWKRDVSANFTDNDERNIYCYLAKMYGVDRKWLIEDAIQIIANEHRYHPIRELLDGLEWDGIPRIGSFLNKYLGVEINEYNANAFKLLLFGAIDRIYHPGCKFDYIIVLIDKKQGGGKSTIIQKLAINPYWFTDDLKNIDSENMYRYIGGKWMIEFGEMIATNNAKSIESIKAFLSKQKDTYKVPYDKYPVDYPRQCVFVGTSNEIDALPSDDTGNRRFIPIEVHSENAKIHPLENEVELENEVKQIWAEAMTLYKNNNYFTSPPKEMMEEFKKMQSSHTYEDVRVGQIHDYLFQKVRNGESCVCIYEIWDNVFGKDGTPKPYESKDIARLLDNFCEDWERHIPVDSKKNFEKYGKQRYWEYKGLNEDGFFSVSDDMDFPFE